MEIHAMRRVLNVSLRTPSLILLHCAFTTYDIVWSTIAACAVGVLALTVSLLVYILASVISKAWISMGNPRKITIFAVILAAFMLGVANAITAYIFPIAVDLPYTMSSLIQHLTTFVFFACISSAVVAIFQFCELQQLIKIYGFGVVFCLHVITVFASDFTTNALLSYMLTPPYLLFSVILQVIVSYYVIYRCLPDVLPYPFLYFGVCLIQAVLAASEFQQTVTTFCSTFVQLYYIGLFVVLSVLYFNQVSKWFKKVIMRVYSVIIVRKEIELSLQDNESLLQLVTFGLGCVFVELIYLASNSENAESTEAPNSSRIITFIVSSLNCCYSIVGLVTIGKVMAFFHSLVSQLLKIFLQWRLCTMSFNKLLTAKIFDDRILDTYLCVLISTVWLSWTGFPTFDKDSFAVLFVLHDLIPSLFERLLVNTERVVMPMATSHPSSKWKHIRIMSVCFMALILSLWMTWMTVSEQNVTAWTLLGLRNWVTVAARPFGTLLMYTMFVYDQRRTEPWDYFDDICLWIRLAPLAISFFVSLALFPLSIVYWYKGQVFLIPVVGLLGMLIMKNILTFNFLHIFWAEVSKQRQDVSHLHEFPLASAEELAKLDDVCAVCYQTMTSARRLDCGHCFHLRCLTKWVYVQTVCPMCRKSLFETYESCASANEVNEAVPHRFFGDPDNENL